jgi:hypothetical protein
MMSEIPFYDSIPQPDQPEKSEVVTSRPKARFQWPPNYLWPFMEHGPETET